MSLGSIFNAALLLLTVLVPTLASPLPAEHESSSLSSVVSMPMSRRAWPHRNATEGTVASTITNGFAVIGNPVNLRASYYYAAIQVGTPPQPLQVIMDTGSSDFFVKGNKYCDTSFGTFCYNHSASSTSEKTKLPKFVGNYGGEAGKQTFLNGTFYSDDVIIGGVKLDNVDMAVIQSGTFNSYGGGLIGLGPRETETTNVLDNVSYPQVLDVLYNSGYIKSHSYSLYLDNLFALSGAIVFGGYDTAKYNGPLVTLPIVPSGGHLAVNWSSISFTDSSGSTSSPLVNKGTVAGILDSGTPTASLPNVTYKAIVKQVKGLGYEVDSVTGAVDCALAQAPGSVDVGFADTETGASVQIAVPWSELTIPVEGGSCGLGVGIGAPDQVIFGDTFMRSMYVVFNLDKSTIGLAQANFNQYASNIVPIL